MTSMVDEYLKVCKGFTGYRLDVSEPLESSQLLSTKKPMDGTYVFGSYVAKLFVPKFCVTIQDGNRKIMEEKTDGKKCIESS